jgi:hypothetical protein
MQDHVRDLFNLFAEQFFEGVEEEIPFRGGYEPDAHQLLSLPLTPEMEALANEIRQGAIGRDRYDPNERAPDEIRALAWAVEEGEHPPIFLQNFTRAQALNRRTVLGFFDGETFSKLEEPALLIGTKIDAVIQRGTILFKKFGVLKQMFDLFDVYREATDQDIAAFAEHPTVHVQNVDELCQIANRTMRKRIFSVTNSGILEQLSAQEIQQRAEPYEIELDIDDGRIALPQDKQAISRVLEFLDHSIYRSPLTDDRWLANSRRRLG